MRKNQRTPPEARARLIAFEGIDSSGKTSLVELVARELSYRGYEVRVLREFGSNIGHLFHRRVLVERVRIPVPVQALIRAAGHLASLAEEAHVLDDPNSLLLADRYVDTNVVYQSVKYSLETDADARGLETFRNWIRDVYGPFYLVPALTFLLDVPARTAIRRAANARRAVKSASFLRMARREYLELAKQSPDYCVVDATAPIGCLQPLVVGRILTLLDTGVVGH